MTYLSSPLFLALFNNLMVGVAHHGDQHVQQNDHTGDVERAVDQITDDFRELIVVIAQLHAFLLRQAEQRPENRFERIAHPEIRSDRNAPFSPRSTFHSRAEKRLCRQLRILVAVRMRNNFDFAANRLTVIPK